MKSPRLERIVQRQYNGRRRDLIFACFIALVASMSASTIGAHVIDASMHFTQR